MRLIGVVIPAYKPLAQLTELVEELVRHNISDIVVVDDGSPKEFEGIFSKLRKKRKVTVLSHKANLGKGAALKTGFKYFCRHHPNALGLVTADADGQHLVSDILRVGRVLQENPHCLILGCRQFDSKVPLRNGIGNRLTHFVFNILLSIQVTDTQTGLRGIPTSLLYDYLELPSGGYAFETESLIASHNKGYKIIEVPVSAIYIENNRSSHFRPLADSLKIYFIFLRVVRDAFRRRLKPW